MSVSARNGAAVDAVILAGGLARRMGGSDKGLVELAGMPMVQWVLQRVSPQVERVTINANRNIERYAALGAPVLQDSRSGHIGPLAGLATALDHFAAAHPEAGADASIKRRVFMCPCDSPFLPDDMVSRMSQAMNDADASVAVASDGQRQQPVFLLVDSSCSVSLVEQASVSAMLNLPITRWPFVTSIPKKNYSWLKRNCREILIDSVLSKEQTMMQSHGQSRAEVNDT